MGKAEGRSYAVPVMNLSLPNRTRLTPNLDEKQRRVWVEIDYEGRHEPRKVVYEKVFPTGAAAEAHYRKICEDLDNGMFGLSLKEPRGELIF